jgi:dienelactone hydrolase
MTTLNPVALHHDGAALEGQIAIPDTPGRHAAVLVMSNAHGLGNQARERVRRLAGCGYVALATDMYGGGALFPEPEDVRPWITELVETPEKLRSRVVAWYEALKARPEVEPGRIGAIGFCFGGQCVLELARSGADVRAVVSYHGLLGTPMPAAPGAIKGRVAAYTGDKDPYVPHAHVNVFREEMIAAGAQWQITEFGETYHSFTDPEADPSHIPGTGYNPLADRLSWEGTLTLLEVALRPPG